MKKLTLLVPALALFATVITSCTTVVEEPAVTSTTTTTRESTSVRPVVPSTRVDQTTTTRTGGY